MDWKGNDQWQNGKNSTIKIHLWNTQLKLIYVSYIRSGKMLEMAFLGLHISGFFFFFFWGGGGGAVGRGGWGHAPIRGFAAQYLAY